MTNTFLGEIASAGGGPIGDLFPPTPAMLLSACFSNSGKVITDICWRAIYAPNIGFQEIIQRLCLLYNIIHHSFPGLLCYLHYDTHQVTCTSNQTRSVWDSRLCLVRGSYTRVWPVWGFFEGRIGNSEPQAGLTLFRVGQAYNAAGQPKT